MIPGEAHSNPAPAATPSYFAWAWRVFRDLGYALRILRKHRGFAAATGLTLALGIGAATAMFSVVDGVLLRPLPFDDPDQVVVMWSQDLASGTEHLPLAHSEGRIFGEENRSVADIAVLDYNGAFPRSVRLGDVDTNLNVAFVSGEFFRVLGVGTEIGRGLEPDDDRMGAAPAVVISHALWRRLFGSDAAVIGRSVELMGQSATIVGVMPRAFDFPQTTEVWATLLPFTGIPGTESSWTYVHLIGRLAPGVTIDHVRTALTTFLQRPDGSAQGRELRGFLQPIHERIVGDIRPLVWALSGAVGLLLLVTVINVATLSLGRTMERRHEFAVRETMGASPHHIFAQVVAESTTLAVIGVLLGLGFAYLLVVGLAAFAPPELPRLMQVGVDGRALLFAAGITLCATVAFGVAPAIQVIRSGLSGPLKAGGRGSAGTSEAYIARRALVVAQVALALVVLAATGLVVRSLANIQGLDWGVAREQLLLAQFEVPEPAAFSSRQQYLQMVNELADRVGAIPGVDVSAPMLVPPFLAESGFDVRFVVEGQAPEEAAGNPVLNMEAATPDYFRTLGIPLLRGRGVTVEDREDSEPVVVVSESVARLAWPDQDPLGHRIRIGGEDGPWRRVVGVVRDTRYRDLTSIRPTVYLAYEQIESATPVFLAIRAVGQPTSVMSAVRSAGNEVLPGLYFPSVRPLVDYATEPLARPRFTAVLFTGFAAVAVLLSTIGLYGVMASYVTQRTREIGIRMAIGAQRRQVMISVMQRGMVLTVAGLGLGLAIALLGTRLLSALLFGIDPIDMITFAAVTAFLAAAGALACYLPAYRATRVDPVVALRAE